ncbi:nucleoside triphosphate pyrophosphohydrolase [Bacillus phage Basilisk]|uniref:dUTPase n=1 Tax=Bacillus phage Basilisk TaxID=1296654 RepID=S5MA84_9CAUD|nr:nucleoside triphosphate pyrophosphohydrolase [Bacillus phage Basilisk]AGR46684.1 DUTPase [Bacillus phage Basilisk]
MEVLPMENTINLKELFDIQKTLDAHIAEKRGLVLTERTSLMKRFFAGIVEFTECANDHQESFKDWKPNNKPKPTTLEEYVDGLHFILSSGNNLAAAGLIIDPTTIDYLPIVLEFNEETGQDEIVMSYFTNAIALELELYGGLQQKMHDYLDEDYHALVCTYLGLANQIGFTPEEIVAAYLDKNKENFARQNGQSTKEGYEA